MVVSYTVPCHRREADWQRVRPSVWTAAEEGAPVELVLVDYGNPAPLTGAAVRVEAAHFHMAHARNVGIRAATGAIILIGSTDIVLHPQTFAVVRDALVTSGAPWVQPARRYIGLIAAYRDVLLDVGGYDERIEFYGPEDKDLAARLTRRYGPPGTYPDGFLSVIRTPDAEKVRHYRLPLTKADMHAHGKRILVENDQRGVWRANAGQAWGSIQPPS